MRNDGLLELMNCFLEAFYSFFLPAFCMNKFTRESLMKTIKNFKNIIYCAEVVQSCITFQNILPHAQCMSSSAYKVHKFL